MGRYDKFAETKINRLIAESSRNKTLANYKISKPKATAVSTQRGHRAMMEELQGE